MRQYCIYIVTNKKRGVLYIGVTGNLQRRIWQHRQKHIDGFTKKYNLDKLVYYEQTENIISAIEREKKLKRFRRKWKIELIEKENSEWKDLYINL